ncbi:hypothetical protein MJL48_33580, partial [Salmonella enterica subsp. enterica serovar Kentucky]|nr:hypothetical protein [Salmonella enterica subsp. enterica serovar Kentucky]
AKLRNVGLPLYLPAGAAPNLSLILGGAGARLDEMAAAYSAFAWYAGANSARAAHGTFTVDADSTFTVTSELDETTANSNWGGSK